MEIVFVTVNLTLEELDRDNGDVYENIILTQHVLDVAVLQAQVVIDIKIYIISK